MRAHAWQWLPETVYLGGGTPSQMDPGRALAECSQPFPEARGPKPRSKPRPAPSPPKKRAPGPTRHQSRQPRRAVVRRAELRRTGRKHTAQTVAADVAHAARAGIANFNIDLIAGLSGQTEASWRESLDWIARLDPPHVSVYMLEIDEDSRLGHEILLGGVALRRQRHALGRSHRRLLRNRRRAPGRARHRALRDLQLRAPRLRIAPQFEVLEARTLRGLRRRCPFLRWRVRAGRISNRSRIICDRRAAPEIQRRRMPGEERFFVGLRLMRRHPPRARGVGAFRRAHPPLPRRRPAGNRRMACFA